ncbi:hypothetical protein [Mucilaginibacter gynuensis]|uniref:hypothetical protein n=1 Tax=Mucilaginibacter gynuensis TaxID=1302236 RepID=UPI0031EC86DB
MKAISKFGILAMLVVSFLITSCSSNRYVAVRPADPYYNRPPVPYRGAVWVPGEWAYRSHRYVYVNGYYTQPRRNHVYVQGHWEQTRRGHVWHKGYWR